MLVVQSFLIILNIYKKLIFQKAGQRVILVYLSLSLSCQSEGQVLREAMYINKSLSFLEQAIIALADHRRDHIPFRQSKLTYALKDSLGRNTTKETRKLTSQQGGCLSQCLYSC